MKTLMTPHFNRRLLPMAIAAALAQIGAPAMANERESLEMLRHTTINLIDALVEQGVLTRAKADALIKQAKDKAAAEMAAAQKDAPTTAADASPKTIRVPYVPAVVKDQIRNELKEEVLAQARAERWGVPNAAAPWTDSVRIYGDVRLRHQMDNYASDNTSAADLYAATLFNDALTRIPTALTTNSSGTPVENTTDDKERLRLRLRLGVDAKLTEMVSAGLRLATGSSTDRVSTNQTLGQSFNKYQLFVDRAFVRLDPTRWLSLSGGRIPNPWFSTDLVWDEDLNFEGLALSAKWPNLAGAPLEPFATAGIFPVRDGGAAQDNRWLYGFQLGTSWQISPRARLKLGLAQYIYTNVEGHRDPDFDIVNGAGPSYGQFEYGSALRQKGNTLFYVNNLDDSSSSPRWGLVTGFRPLVLTAAAELAYFGPNTLFVSAEYAINKAFKRDAIAHKLGFDLADGRGTGALLRAAFGRPQVAAEGDWQVSFTYRWLGSDAVLDAFTDSDFNLGGTNSKGYTLGLSYGLDKNTSLNLRYLSGESIDSPSTFLFPTDKFSVDSLQLDLNVRF